MSQSVLCRRWTRNLRLSRRRGFGRAHPNQNHIYFSALSQTVTVCTTSWPRTQGSRRLNYNFDSCNFERKMFRRRGQRPRTDQTRLAFMRGSAKAMRARQAQTSITSSKHEPWAKWTLRRNFAGSDDMDHYSRSVIYCEALCIELEPDQKTISVTTHAGRARGAGAAALCASGACAWATRASGT